MSIFTSPISQLKTSDLQELLTDKAVENARLEFKSDVPNKDETLKKLSSFANTFGGFMVVGAKANSADGRIEDLTGVDEQSGYKQKVVDWCFGGSSPPLTVGVSDPIPAPGGTGKVCYVIHVAESDVAPHFLNGRKGIWVRTDEFSSRFNVQLADENELRHLLDRRKLVFARREVLAERASSRFGVYASRSYGKQISFLGSRLDMFVAPRFPSRPLCEQVALKPLIMQNLVQWRGVLFPNPSKTAVSQHESAIMLGATGRPFSFFEGSIWGSLFYGTGIFDAAEGEHRPEGIHLYSVVGHIMLFLRHAHVMLKAMGYSGPVDIETTLASTLGIPWLYGDHLYSGVFSKAGSTLDADVKFSVSTTTDVLDQNPDSVAMDVLRYVFFSVDWADQVDTPEKVANLVRYGHVFNGWRRA